MSDDQPIEPDLVEILEQMREKGNLAFEASFEAFQHMSNMGFILVEARTAFMMNTEPDESLGHEGRLEHDRQIAAQMTALRLLCEAAALVPELRRRYDAHGHKEVPFGFFLAYVSNWAEMRKAEALNIKYLISKAKKAEAEGRRYEPEMPEKPWTVRDANRYQKMLAQWATLEAAVQWDSEQDMREIDQINITTATKLLKLYQQR